jgi:hypothetical protein
MFEKIVIIAQKIYEKYVSELEQLILYAETEKLIEMKHAKHVKKMFENVMHIVEMIKLKQQRIVEIVKQMSINVHDLAEIKK